MEIRSLGQVPNYSMCDSMRPGVFTLTTPQQYPYAVFVHCEVYYGQSYICSGSLLSSTWVISAGHCFRHCSEVYIYAGGSSMYEMYKATLPKGSQKRKVVKVCKNSIMDVSLAMVEHEFRLTKYVNTVKLAADPLPMRRIVNCTFTAFGRIQLDEKDNLDFRRKTQTLEVVSPCECYLAHWQDRQVWEQAANGSNFICSVPRSEYGTCKGDSGSGLVNNNLLYGVATSIFTDRNIEACILEDPETKKLLCGSAKTSSVFTSIYPLTSWIDKTLQGHSYLECSSADKSSVSPSLLVLIVVLSSKSCTLYYQSLHVFFRCNFKFVSLS